VTHQSPSVAQHASTAGIPVSIAWTGHGALLGALCALVICLFVCKLWGNTVILRRVRELATRVYDKVDNVLFSQSQRDTKHLRFPRTKISSSNIDRGGLSRQVSENSLYSSVRISRLLTAIDNQVSYIGINQFT
jgi:hypothetical protein